MGGHFFGTPCIYDVRAVALEWFKSYLSGRKTVVNNVASYITNVLCGVPTVVFQDLFYFYYMLMMLILQMCYQGQILNSLLMILICFIYQRCPVFKLRLQ